MSHQLTFTDALLVHGPKGRDWQTAFESSYAVALRELTLRHENDLGDDADVLVDFGCRDDSGAGSMFQVKVFVNSMPCSDCFMWKSDDEKPLSATFEVIWEAKPILSYGPVEVRVSRSTTEFAWRELAQSLGFHLVLGLNRVATSQSFQRLMFATSNIQPLTFRSATIDLIRRVGRGVRNRLLSRRKTKQWAIGLVDRSGRDFAADIRLELQHDLQKVKWLIPPKDRFWADPFVVKHDDKVFVLFEELRFKENVGRLAYFQIMLDKSNWKVADIEHLQLDPPTSKHMSYPFVFSDADEHYLVPECASSGNLDLYKSTHFPKQWKFDRTLISNFHAIDPTLFRYENRIWLFVSDALLGNRDNNLLLYWSDDLAGPFHRHPQCPIRLGLRGSRMGGSIVKKNGELFRIGQDCSESYGGAIVLFKILELTVEKYSEIEVGEIRPDKDGMFPLGIHSFSVAEDRTWATFDGVRAI